MRNFRFVSLKPNYRRSILEVVLEEGRNKKKYDLPFSAFKGLAINARNPFRSIAIDKRLGSQAAKFELADGSCGDFPADLVLSYCDPGYDWFPVNRIKATIKKELKASRISVRTLAKGLQTSPSQVVRLFEEDRAAKQLLQLIQAAAIAGFDLEFNLKRKKAA